MLTPSQKTRVGVSRNRASGRKSRRGSCRSMFMPGSRGCAYKTVSGRHEWPNRDPLGEPGFETLHLVAQPLFIRKLRLKINDSEMQYLLAMAMQRGSIDVGSYLHNSHMSYRGTTISVLAFFNLMRSGQGTYAPNWPVEMLEYPNLFGFVGNDPLGGIDPQGLWWWVFPSSGEDWKMIWEWLKTVASAGNDTIDKVNMANDTLKCGLGMYNIYTNEPPKLHYDPFDPSPTNHVPPTAG